MDYGILRWCLSGVFALVFIISAIGNGVILFLATIMKRKDQSLIPLVGGIFGVLFLLVVPIQGAANRWWIPLFVDLGCVPNVIYAFAYLVFSKKASRFGTDSKPERR